MRMVQIGFAVVVGLVYIGIRMFSPEMGSMAVWGLRLGVLVLIGAFFAVTNVLSGRTFDTSPLEEGEMPSLNLTGTPGSDADPGGNIPRS